MAIYNGAALMIISSTAKRIMDWQVMDYNTISNALAFLFLSLGIKALPNEFFAGLFLAVSGGYFAAIWMPPQDRRDIKLMLATAVIVATMAAIVHPKVAAGWPLSFVMGVSGLLSRYAIAIVLGVSSRTMGKTDQMAEDVLKTIFGHSSTPEKDKEKDEEK